MSFFELLPWVVLGYGNDAGGMVVLWWLMSQEIHDYIFRWRKFYYSFKIMNCWQSKPPWLSRLLGRMEYCYFMTKRTVKAMPSSVKPMFACYGIHTRRWIQSHTLLHFSLSIWSMIDMVQFTCITIEVIERGLRVGLRVAGRRGCFDYVAVCTSLSLKT